LLYAILLNLPVSFDKFFGTECFRAERFIGKKGLEISGKGVYTQKEVEMII
jgi:hypothetical protein